MAYFYERPFSLYDQPTPPLLLAKHYTGKSMDLALFNRSDLKYLYDLREEIESDWGSLENFLADGYGYCVIDQKENALASWAVIGNIARSCAELGIDTINEYQRQGLAHIVAFQMISISYQKGFTPHWYCFQNNVASVKLAEKVNFQKFQEFSVHVIEKKP